MSDASALELHTLVYLDGGSLSLARENILELHAGTACLLDAGLGLFVYSVLELSRPANLTGQMTSFPAELREGDAVCIGPLDDIAYMIGMEHGDRISAYAVDMVSN